MEFFRRAAGQTSRLGIFPGTFNPVTVAHLALAEAALPWWTKSSSFCPGSSPTSHTPAHLSSSGSRCSIWPSRQGPRFSIAACEGGLFVEIAAECREAYGADVRLSFLCGRDAAERIANWDYGRPGAFLEMLRQFDFLVAARSGEYCPPERLPSSFARLELNGAFDHVSASEVRTRIGRGEPWEHLVPPAVRRQCRAKSTAPKGATAY